MTAHPFRRVTRTVPTGPHTAYDELECGHRFTWLDYYRPRGWHRSAGAAWHARPRPHASASIGRGLIRHRNPRKYGTYGVTNAAPFFNCWPADAGYTPSINQTVDRTPWTTQGSVGTTTVKTVGGQS